MHDINDDSEDNSYQQSYGGGEPKQNYNLNKLNANFGNFFQSDIKLSENEKKKEEKEENNEKKSEKDKFMADLYDEMDIGDSGLNNNSSKASQKDSKIKNKSTNKSMNKNIKKQIVINYHLNLITNKKSTLINLYNLITYLHQIISFTIYTDKFFSFSSFFIFFLFLSLLKDLHLIFSLFKV